MRSASSSLSSASSTVIFSRPASWICSRESMRRPRNCFCSSSSDALTRSRFSWRKMAMFSCSSPSVMASLFTTATTRSATSSLSGGRGRLHLGGWGEREERAAGAGLDPFDPEGPGGATDADDVEELLDFGRRRTKAVGELGTELAHGIVAAGAGQTLVKGQSLIDLGDIIFRQESFSVDADHRLDRHRCRFAFQFCPGLG